MDFLGMLNGLKGKVLDAAHFDLLKSAYDLQNENITQLKSNNEALKENAELVRGQVEQLRLENHQLLETNKELLSELKQINQAKRVGQNQNLSPTDCLALIQSWLGSRSPTENERAIRYAAVDSELNLALGSAKKYIEEAARSFNYVPERKGDEVILFVKVSYDSPSVSDVRW
jgi:hypothetical protein